MSRSLTREYRILAELVGAVTLLVYLPALKGGFLNWDDNLYIFGNPHINTINLNFFKWAFFSFFAGNWHPVTWLSHALDYSLWGSNPVGHHLMSIVFHAVNTTLVVILSSQLLLVDRAYKINSAKDMLVLSDNMILTVGTIAGLLFGLHPIHVESVAWVSERKDLLCAFFFLCSLLTYIKYAQFSTAQESATKPVSWLSDKHYLLSLGFFVLALMSKSMAVTLPLVLLIIDWYPMRRVRKDTLKRIFMEKVIFLVFAVHAAIIAILAQGSGYAIQSSVEYPLTTRLLVCLNSIIAYMIKMIWPVNLSPFYLYPAHVSLWSFDYMAPLLLVIIITITFTTILRQQRIWLAAWMYFLVTLLPVLGIIQVGNQAMADRYSYLPSISLFLLAAIGAAVSAEKVATFSNLKSTVVKIAYIAILSIPFVCISFATVKQIHVWNNSVSLWTRVVALVSSKGDAYYKKSFLMYFNLGAAYLETNRLEEAISAYQKASTIDPNFALAHFYLGKIYNETNRPEKAIKSYLTALRIDPNFALAHFNLGNMYNETNRPEEAIKSYLTALRIDPNFALAHFNLGNMYKKMNRSEEAIGEYLKELRNNPDLTEVRINLALLYVEQNRLMEAINEFKSALRTRPDDFSAHYHLGGIYEKQNKFDEAVNEYHLALEIHPNFVLAHHRLGIIYYKQNKLDEAINEYRLALKINPGFSESQKNLDRINKTNRVK